MRPMRLTADISSDGNWYVAQCAEVDVASQGGSVEDARDNLVEALALHFDDHDCVAGGIPMPIEVALRHRDDRTQ